MVVYRSCALTQLKDLAKKKKWARYGSWVAWDIRAGEQKPRFTFHNVIILLYLHTFTFILIFLYTFACLFARFPSSNSQFGSARVTRLLKELASHPECQPTRGGKNEGDGVSECNRSLVQRSRKFIAMLLAFFIPFFYYFFTFF